MGVLSFKGGERHLQIPHRENITTIERVDELHSMSKK